MANLLFTIEVLTLILSLYIGTLLVFLQHNIAVAKASGLPYVVVPCHTTGLSWLVLQPAILPILNLLPYKWTNGWLP